ncbi:hypothetical protein [Paracoccus fontiphilus]|uniref:hypothetical protein n=1 Tax=Paracoccus fontiphilus TaxID=1815556 RepID=UPI001A956F61|nr:hypothetical protein [Paracoccus fontiphilus]
MTLSVLKVPAGIRMRPMLPPHSIARWRAHYALERLRRHGSFRQAGWGGKA